MKASLCEQLDIRGLRYNVRHWGSADAPAVFFLHGWMDTSATFQFLVDALAHDWHVIAPDWRGYGASEWLGRPYWFPDYYGDLDALLAHYSPDRPARLVGHSMGAAISSAYSGVRPDRVAQLVMMDFLGLTATAEDDAPAQLAGWLDNLRKEQPLRGYADHDAFARRLQLANPRLTGAKAAFLARHVSRTLPDGQVTMAGDPWHKVPSPVRYQAGDVMAAWRGIKAPVLMMLADKGYVAERFADAPAEIERRLACFADMRRVTITDSGHNLQHDQPEQVAAAIEAFLARD
ncbi:alpha/beta fold hydrolase [Aromatoleum toluvorans]|uniref:Alpha/beta fold hydrolase n=1 Tax=Aromatoleum toluvorans TaxID=92002 RepID=A0ABX1Q1U4_9RHOO|nr:alpha/beta hydrolase [Aromatoleum toluvorans]NMG44726.1 alpha/beta fold hydrolase [Aromatoleum toluvorans]